MKGFLRRLRIEICHHLSSEELHEWFIDVDYDQGAYCSPDAEVKQVPNGRLNSAARSGQEIADRVWWRVRIIARMNGETAARPRAVFSPL